MFRNKGFFFYGHELLAPRPIPKLEDHLVSAARDCLFNIFPATLLIGGRFSILNPRTRHAVVTGTHLSHGVDGRIILGWIFGKWDVGVWTGWSLLRIGTGGVRL
jgi:hypothetical protein